MFYGKAKPGPFARLDWSDTYAQNMILCPVLVPHPGIVGVYDAAQKQNWDLYMPNNKQSSGVSNGGRLRWKKANSVSGQAAYSGLEGDWCLDGSGGMGAMFYQVERIPIWNNPANAYSAMAIFKPLNTTAGTIRIGDTNSGNPFFYYNVVSSKVRFSWYPTNNTPIQTDVSFSLGDWITLFMSFSSGVGKAYINGTLVYTQNGASPNADLNIVNQWNNFSTTQKMWRIGITSSLSATADRAFTPITCDLSAFMVWREWAGTAQDATNLWQAPFRMLKPAETFRTSVWLMPTEFDISENDFGSEGVSSSANATVNESGLGSETLGLQVSATVSESGLGSENATNTANMTISESGQGSEAIGLVSQAIISEIDSGSESFSASEIATINENDFGSEGIILSPTMYFITENDFGSESVSQQTIVQDNAHNPGKLSLSLRR